MVSAAQYLQRIGVDAGEQRADERVLQYTITERASVPRFITS